MVVAAIYGRSQDVAKLPVGTQVFAEDNETLICDLTIGQRHLWPRAAMALWYLHFKSSRNRSRRANPGLEGTEMWIWLRETDCRCRSCGL